MEVQQHQELVEMAEDSSKVYDIIHPTPVPLKQLSAIVISLEIWRRKINEYRTGRKLKNFYPSEIRIKYSWIKKILPDLPSTIYKTIEEFFSTLRHSMEYWLTHHFDRGFCYQYSEENYVLKDFDDFVCDYDGSIHYVRTAERMMRCERFNSEMKFMIACMYFFEDDIRRIWPSVSISNNVNIDFIRFQECPQLYYWICLLSDQLDKIQTWRNETVDEKMLRAFMPYNRPSVEYFWNRLPIEKQMRIPVGVAALSNSDFVRYILPKMDDQQLDKFFNDSWDADNLYDLFLYLHCDEWAVLRTWLHIRNIIKESNFSNCIVRMLEIEQYCEGPEECHERVKWTEFHEPEKWEYLCCQIWKHTPLNLKQSAIRLISSENTWFEETGIKIYEYNDSNMIHVEFLLLILQDASLKERTSFWHNRWRTLIEVVRTEDLQRMVRLCFKNNDDITHFKQNFMINSRDVFQFCVRLLEGAFFEKLNGLVSFCCAESEAARNLKQRILQSVFLDGDCKRFVISGIVDRSRHFNEFINDAFDNIDASTDFKNLLMSSSSIVKHLSSIICDGLVSSKKLNKFIDSVVSTEEALTQIKIRLIDSLKEYVTTNADVRDYVFDQNLFNSILLWLVGDDQRVEEFKLSCTS